MKKTILLFAVFASTIAVNAQKAVEVDPHAGHNHAKETVVAVPVTATKTAVTEKATKVAKETAKTKAKQKGVGKVTPVTLPSQTAISGGNVANTAQTGMVTDNATQVINAAPAPVLPETLVAKELEFDFGKIPQGKPVTHVFTVTNSSKAPYKLDNVQASCGCTTPEWEREKVIAPGESVDIKVGFNAGAVAPFTKPVTITYNGTQTKVLNIKGEVYATPATSAPANVEAAEIKK